MLVCAYFTVVGAVLIALLFLADARSGDHFGLAMISRACQNRGAPKHVWRSSRLPVHLIWVKITPRVNASNPRSLVGVSGSQRCWLHSTLLAGDPEQKIASTRKEAGGRVHTR
jgi:hypothetical protein